MGNTAKAILHFEGRQYSGEALLETVKVVKFSETHSAEKYVIPLASRPRQ